ncbi:MAG: hypothetical protein Q8R28_21830 [Dehalococcoidia bacterium]|nr:hypothetical protein [Dehalococcoidia bacterium]
MIEETETDADTENVRSQAGNKPRYHIDLDWHQRKRRSLREMIGSRLCPPCQARLGADVEERVTKVTGQGEVLQEVQSVPFPTDPIAQIRDCCSKFKDFIRPSMPLQEAVFRVILANGNQPLDAEEICQQLEWMGYGERARFISPTSIQRILEADDFYGFASSSVDLQTSTEPG